MNENITSIKDKVLDFWRGISKKKKIILASSALFIIVFVVVMSMILSRENLVTLYSGLDPSETGSIKEALDAKGVTSEIAENGTAILVPQELVDSLKVDLAAQGIPESGSIDYSFFSQNAGIGMTDNEFDVLKLEAMQSELASLYKNVNGIQDANVMLTIPEKGIFVSDSTGTASASIVLTLKTGYELKSEQIETLYHLAAKSVPNLPVENIVIMDNHANYYDLKGTDNSDSTNVANQMGVKKEIERDLQRQIQNMLGTIMGSDKVVVSVTSDIDFSQKASTEDLVTPVDEENMAGITISAQRLTETYSGNGENIAEGVPQAEDADDTLDGYAEVDGAEGTGEYEKVEETINNEVNRFHNEIVEAPYRIRDLGIQVMVEAPDADNPNSLSDQTIDDITQILTTMVRTSLDSEQVGELTDEEIAQRISVSAQTFNGKKDVAPANEPQSEIPLWVWIVAGLLLVALVVIVILYIRNRRERNRLLEEAALRAEEEANRESIITVTDVNEEVETEAVVKQKQLEKLAKEKPNEFAKLLRTWLSND